MIFKLKIISVKEKRKILLNKMKTKKEKKDFSLVKYKWLIKTAC